MSKFKTFEELPVWQKAKKLAILVFDLSTKGKLAKHYGLKDQIQRSAISISSNIAEGFERGSKQEFIHFLYIARGSSGELRSQLLIARELGYVDNNSFTTIHDMLLNLSKQLNGFIEYLKRTTIKGQKFK